MGACAKIVVAVAIAVVGWATPAMCGSARPKLPVMNWSVPGGAEYFRITIPLTVTRAARPVGDQVGPGAFYSTQFWFEPGGGGYIGLLDLSGNRRVALFSIWDAVAVRCPVAAGAKCNPFREDGTGFQTMVPFNFVEGRTYLLTLSYAGTDFGGTWWNGDVVDQRTGATTRIGSIQTPLSWGGLEPALIQWIEWIGNASRCDQIPETNVSWGYPRFDNDRLGLHHVPAAPKPGVVHQQNPCPAYAG